MNWIALTSLDQLDTLVERSFQKPVLIFKHSTRCSISSAALDRLERRWQKENTESLDAYFLDLIQFREISSEVANRFSVFHQSPQAILIFQGKVLYEESHFSIDLGEIANRVQSLSIQK